MNLTKHFGDRAGKALEAAGVMTWVVRGLGPGVRGSGRPLRVRLSLCLVDAHKLPEDDGDKEEWLAMLSQRCEELCDEQMLVEIDTSKMTLADRSTSTVFSYGVSKSARISKLALPHRPLMPADIHLALREMDEVMKDIEEREKRAMLLPGREEP